MTIATSPADAIHKRAAIIVDDYIAARAGSKGYDSGLRQQAIDSVANFQPAYVRLSDYGDQTSTCAATWAMGGLLGLPNLDPATTLWGLRAVANHMAAIWPADFEEKLRHVLRNLKPINAMAQLDRELLLEERAISRADSELAEDKIG